MKLNEIFSQKLKEKAEDFNKLRLGYLRIQKFVLENLGKIDREQALEIMSENQQFTDRTSLREDEYIQMNDYEEQDMNLMNMMENGNNCPENDMQLTNIYEQDNEEISNYESQ